LIARDPGEQLIAVSIWNTNYTPNVAINELGVLTFRNGRFERTLTAPPGSYLLTADHGEAEGRDRML